MNTSKATVIALALALAVGFAVSAYDSKQGNHYYCQSASDTHCTAYKNAIKK